MAGHFLVWGIAQADITWCTQHYANSTWGTIQHQAVGWNAGSRAVLQNVKNGIGIGNRNGLPPHRYLEFPGGEPSAVQRQRLLSNDALWTLNMERPNVPGLGLTALCPAAEVEWAEGRKRQALFAQITHGATSIEVYYIGRNEMA